MSSEIEAVGAQLLGDMWGGVHASNTLPAQPAQSFTCRVCNTAYGLNSPSRYHKAVNSFTSQ